MCRFPLVVLRSEPAVDILSAANGAEQISRKLRFLPEKCQINDARWQPWPAVAFCPRGLTYLIL